MTIISTDSETQFSMDHDGQLLVIKAGVALAVETIAVSSQFASCTISNYGTIDGQAGVSTTGEANKIFNHFGGTISGASAGIEFSGRNTYLSNEGAISGGHFGVLLTGSLDGGSIFNSGSISSAIWGIFIETESGYVTTVVNTGTIAGTVASIINDQLYCGSLNLNNSGFLIGDVDVHFDGASSTIINTGDVQGDVRFGAHNDLYDGHGGGVVSGTVFGGGGNDTLTGGEANDMISGGAGKDRLNGGRGEDTYVFGAASESKVSSFDVIRHWNSGDLLDLSGIDADTHTKGHQDLTFGGAINASDPVGAGQVEYFHKSGDTYVVADVNGDGRADFEVRLIGSVTLQADNFVLG